MIRRLIILLLIVGCATESAIEGCTTTTACNYNTDATEDDGSCTYAEENYDCEGNCTAEIDCAGECDGSTVVDECGVCGGGATEDECGTSFGTWYCQADTGGTFVTGFDSVADTIVTNFWEYCIDDSALYFGKWVSKIDCENAGCQTYDYITGGVTQTWCSEMLCLPAPTAGDCAQDTGEGNPNSGNTCTYNPYQP